MVKLSARDRPRMASMRLYNISIFTGLHGCRDAATQPGLSGHAHLPRASLVLRCRQIVRYTEGPKAQGFDADNAKLYAACDGRLITSSP